MARGGIREGAGKPKGYKAPHTLAAQTAKARAVAMVEAELEAIFLPQIEKAKAGDTQAFTAVLDRAWGKPAQAIVGDPENDSPISLLVKFLDNDSNSNRNTQGV